MERAIVAKAEKERESQDSRAKPRYLLRGEVEVVEDVLLQILLLDGRVAKPSKAGD